MAVGAPSCRFDVGAREIIPLEQQRFIARPRQGIREAVAIIQSRRMPAFAEASPGKPGDGDLVGIDSNDLNAGFMEPKIELRATDLTEARLDDDGEFKNGRG
jgi:hypothetical protein